MRKVFPFEISVAIKDRSKRFQFVTLGLFLFCLAVILVGIVIRVVEPMNGSTVENKHVSDAYAGIRSATTFYGIQK